MARGGAQAGTFRVLGYREFVRASAQLPKDEKRFVREAFRESGRHVQVDAAARFAPYSPRSAAGYRVVVRQRGVAVDQSLRKTTGLRADFGALQMRKALVPSLYENQDETERAFEHAMQKVTARFEAGTL